jgi:glycosyltransferase involved in cell wall biosynthesis
VRVLVSTFQCAPGYGGEIGNGWLWATSLADRGHEVTVLTHSEWREHVEAGGRSDIDFQFIDATGVPVRLAGIYNFDTYRRFQNMAYEHAAGLGRDFDVMHHTGWGSLHLGSRLWRLPAPLVFGSIGGGQTAPAAYWRYFGPAWATESVRSVVTTQALLKANSWARETVRNSRVVLVSNSATEAAVRKLGAKDVRHFMAEGVPQEWVGAPRQQPAGVPIVLWVGRMLARKAPVLAVQAFAELRKTTEARLVMAGDGPLRPQVHAAVEELGLTGDVDILGRVDWPDLAQLYASASLFLFCSLRDSGSAQVLEALAKALPAVILDLHGMADIKVGIAAEKVPLTRRPAELPGQLAAAMRTVLTGDDWDARSAAAVEWASEHAFPSKAAATSRIYEEIAGR